MNKGLLGHYQHVAEVQLALRIKFDFATQWASDLLGLVVRREASRHLGGNA